MEAYSFELFSQEPENAKPVSPVYCCDVVKPDVPDLQ